MNIIPCLLGHYYDADRFKACPHCTAQNKDNENCPEELKEDDCTKDTVQEELNNFSISKKNLRKSNYIKKNSSKNKFKNF